MNTDKQRETKDAEDTLGFAEVSPSLVFSVYPEPLLPFSLSLLSTLPDMSAQLFVFLPLSSLLFLSLPSFALDLFPLNRKRREKKNHTHDIW